MQEFAAQGGIALFQHKVTFHISYLISHRVSSFWMFEADKTWMHVAIEAAKAALAVGEVPVGACIVDDDGQLLASAYNLTITNSDPTAHAEILAVRAAATALRNYRLTGVTMYSTIEPCAMCAGALVNARIKRLVFGAHDERYGAVETHFGLCTSDLLNHRVDVVSGVLADDCRTLMQDFFRARRQTTER